MSQTGAVLVVVGAGPRGVGLLERLLANLPELYPTQQLTVHVVDPHPFGAVRRAHDGTGDVSHLLGGNARAGEVTLFPDRSVTMTGPARPGPTLAEWSREQAQRARAGAPDADGSPAGLSVDDFPDRGTHSEYLAWVFWHAVNSAPARVSVQVHPERALNIVEDTDGRHLVHLEHSRAPIAADCVVLAVGHPPTQPVGQVRSLSEAADRQGLTYLPPDSAADADLTRIAAGQEVIVRGLGLGFFDFLALLTLGRGGAFAPESGDRLRYLPSGKEPLLYVGSRRGVPYHCQGEMRRCTTEVTPRFLVDERIRPLLDRSDPLDFRADVWPLVVKEISYAYYRELCTAHAVRVEQPWERFAAGLDTHDWDAEALAATVEATVIDPVDRLDLSRLDRPIAQFSCLDPEELQRHVRQHIADDLSRRRDPRHSADLALIRAVQVITEPVTRIVESGRLGVRSRLADVPWFLGLCDFLTRGPSPQRMRQLLALSRAGVVRFLGADMWVRVEAGPVSVDGARFAAGGSNTPEKVRTRVLLEARQPQPSLSRSAEPLLLALVGRGMISEEQLQDPVEGRRAVTGRMRVASPGWQVVDRSGEPHPRRFAVGPLTTAPLFTGLPRPGADALFFRQNDTVARAVLTALEELATRPESTPPETTPPTGTGSGSTGTGSSTTGSNTGGSTPAGSPSRGTALPRQRDNAPATDRTATTPARTTLPG